MIHNDDIHQIHQILTDISAEQGWNKESQIFHLCVFISWIRRNGPLHELKQEELEEKFRTYLQNMADDENDFPGIET